MWRIGGDAKRSQASVQRGRALGQRAPGVFERRSGADRQHAVLGRDAFQLGHFTDVDDVAQVAHLLVDPQADVGGAGEQLRLRMRQPQARELAQRARREEAIGAAGRVRARRSEVERAARQRTQGRGGRIDRQPLDRQLEHALAGIEDRPVAGAAAQVAGQISSASCCRVGFVPLAGKALVACRQRHHEARRAEAALRAVAVDHRLLHRVQRVAAGVAHVFHREQRLAVQRGQEADAGVDALQLELAAARRLADDHRAGTAVAFGAAFLGAGAARVFAQPLQHGAGGRSVGDLDQAAAVVERDRARAHLDAVAP